MENNELKSQQLIQELFSLKYDKQQNIVPIDKIVVFIVRQQLCKQIFTDAYRKQTPRYKQQIYMVLYLISINEESLVKSQIVVKQFPRNLLIKEIYKNTKKQEINILQFYLNVRKRNKFCKRVSQIQKQIVYGQISEKDKQNGFTFMFKIYENHEDWKKEKNERLFLLVDPEDQITTYLYNPFVEKFKKLNKIQKYYVCIFQNNDFVVAQVLD